MMSNIEINRKAVQTIANALGDLNKEVVYVGGAVVSLYVDDVSAEDVRPTKDVDISLEIVGLGALESLRKELVKKGFYQTAEDPVICRFRYKDIKVDVMATKAVGWAPANPWFAPGFSQQIEVPLETMSIKLLPLSYYMASKLTAFYDRGITDPRTSHDFEDIVYLLNHTSYLKEHILSSEKTVKTYLQKCFKDILTDETKQEAILGNLVYENQELRYNKIIQILEEITDGL